MKVYDEAIENLESSLKIKDDDPKTYYILNLVLQKLNRYDKALTILNDGLAIFKAKGDKELVK